MPPELTFLGDVYLPKPARVDIPDLGRFVPNLEYPITQCGQGAAGKVNLKAERNYLLASFPAAPTAVCLANNHILDYGEQGFQDTLTQLRDCEIPYFGAGKERDRYHNPLLLDVEGITVALLGYACPSTSAIIGDGEQAGAAKLDLMAIREDVQEARNSGAQVVVVSIHWGAEQVHLPKPDDVAIARSIVDAGADLLIGHHSHCIQPYEVYKGKPIFYGLGNCIFPDLDVPSYFKDGQPTQRYIYRQYGWNKTSLGVKYDLASGRFTVMKLKYENDELKVVQRNCTQYRLRVGDPESYPRKFKKSFMLGKLRTAAMGFLTRPKLPRARHFRALISLSKAKVYK